MDVVAEKIEKIGGYTYVTLSCGKKRAFIDVHPKHEMSLNVTCLNASHNAWGGSGNYFSSEKEALNHYKSKEMKAMIQFAVNA